MKLARNLRNPLLSPSFSGGAVAARIGETIRTVAVIKIEKYAPRG
jgi:hypothetical protein